MSELAAMGVGVVVGGMVGASYTRTMDTVGQRQRALRKHVKETNKRLANVGDLVRYRGELERLRAKQAGAAVSSKRLDDGVREVARRYKAAKRELKAYGVEVGDAAREQRRLQRELRATQRTQTALQRRERAGARLRGMRGMAVGATGMAYGAARLVGQAMDLEEQRLHLRTVIVAEDPEAAVGDAVEHARALARQSLASEAELLEIQYQLGSAGIDAETARVATEVAHKVAVVTRGEGAEVAGIVGAVEKNLADGMAGTVEERVGTIGDVLAKGQAMFKFSNFGDLGQAMAKATTGAKTMKLGLVPLTAALGHLVGGELSGEEAGTAMTTMMLKLGDATSKLGTRIVRTADGGLDLFATLDLITEATESMSFDERAEALTKAFGIDGLKAVSLLREATGQLRKDVEQLGDADGFADERYARFAASASGQWKTLSGNLAQVGTMIASQLLPALNAVVGPLASAGGWLASLAERSPIVGKVIGGVAAAVLAFAGAAVIGTAATWAWNVAMLANPMVWVGALVVGLAAAIVYYWSPIKEFFKSLWNTDGVKAFIRGVGDVVVMVRKFLQWTGLVDDDATWGDGWGQPQPGDAQPAAQPQPGDTQRSAAAGNAEAAALDVVPVPDAAFAAAPTQDVVPVPGAALPVPGAAFAAAPTQDVVPAGAVAAGATFGAAAAPTQDVVPAGANFAAIPSGSAPAATTSSGRGGVSVQVTANITVQPPAGADEQEIAREVARQLADAMRRAAVEARLGESDG